MMNLLAQDIPSLNPTLVNAGMGGIAVFSLMVLAYFFKLWVEERKVNAEIMEAHSTRLVDVIGKSNEVIANNTQAIVAAVRQSEAVAAKVDDLKDRLGRLKCIAELGK